MQTELSAQPIRLHGVNSIGAESRNAEACDGKDIPWLQDTVAEDLWNQWAVTYRDVWVLNDENVPVAVYNLTDNDLADPAKYAELKAILQSFVP